MPRQGRATLQERLHRIQGQLTGIEKMVDANEDLEKVMIQMQAVISSLESMKREIVRKQISSAVNKHIDDALDLLK